MLRIERSLKDPKVFSFKYFEVEDVNREISNINKLKGEKAKRCHTSQNSQVELRDNSTCLNRMFQSKHQKLNIP